MGYQPRRKSPQAANHEYTKTLRERKKDKERKSKLAKRPAPQENLPPTAQEVSEGTLRRLHTLGNQRFGTSPFSEHFDRWLTNVKWVLCEFESNPNIAPDTEFIQERSQILSKIELQLQELRQKESTLTQETKNLSDCKNRLEQFKTDYVAMVRELRGRKNREIRRLYGAINRLNREQAEVVQVKTGFLRGIFGKDRGREQRETEISQELADKQRELELAMLEFNAAQGRLKEEYQTRREPVVEQVKVFLKKLDELETDGSLEERWFASEALADAVNTFLQRKNSSAALAN